MNKIGENVKIFEDVILGDNITIGDNCYIDHGCIIRDNVTIGSNSFIGANSVLGEYLIDFYDGFNNKNHPLIIGENAIIRSGTIIYGDTIIGNGFSTGHKTTIRENNKIGNSVSIGTMSDIQDDCEINDYVNIHSSVFVGSKAHIESYVWIFPHCVLTNDPTPPSSVLEGVTIKEYASIAANSVVLPGKTIEEHALVGAGSIVTKDVKTMTCVVGNPAKPICKVDEIMNNKGEKKYPWPFHFSRRMPWEEIGFDKWKKNIKEEKNEI